MRKRIYALMAMLLLLVACASRTGQRLRVFIPGVYARAIDQEFAVGHDTLIIRHVQDNNYEIIRRSTFRPIRNGRKLAPVYSREAMIGLFDECNQVIREQRKGKLLRFFPMGNKLLLGSSEYRKVKL
ncbi:MAG: hypothetical protein J0I32_23440 [Sphingobacteriales bacterium]|nr:hypothetical protein [Sphingobacteriales bacterium]OJW01995.1 MAG: hypothetical protein BGO52_00495 [Sphingobacteriales bacterium 44-61]